MIVTSPLISALPGIRHGWFTREGGVSSGVYASLNTGLGSADARANVLENRRRIAAAFGIETPRLLSCYQTHSADAVIVEQPWDLTDPPKADALVTRTPFLALAVSSADCGPVLCADAEAGVIGAAHAGWKGAFTGIVEAMIAAMVALGARREAIVAVIGPMISARAYEVGPEFIARFVEAGEDAARWFAPSVRLKHGFFDLPAYIVERLRRAGLRTIQNLDLCTYADAQRFFSYRRMVHHGESDYGRHLSAIMLDNEKGTP